MNKYEIYLQAKNNTKAAKEWNNLPNSKAKYRNDSFEVVLHTAILKLERCGQHFQGGGNNYWPMPKEMTNSLLEVIKENQNELFTKAINKLKEKEKQALLECRDFAEKILKNIKEKDESNE